MGSFYRNVRTGSARRQSQYRGFNYVVDGYRVKSRASQNFRNIPNAWDDIRRNDWRLRKSWKRYRRHQYHETAPISAMESGAVPVSGENCRLAVFGDVLSKQLEEPSLLLGVGRVFEPLPESLG